MAIRFNGLTAQQATEMEQAVGLLMDTLGVDELELHVRTVPITRVKLQRVSESQSTFPRLDNTRTARPTFGVDPDDEPEDQDDDEDDERESL